MTTHLCSCVLTEAMTTPVALLGTPSLGARSTWKVDGPYETITFGAPSAAGAAAATAAGASDGGRFCGGCWGDVHRPQARLRDAPECGAGAVGHAASWSAGWRAGRRARRGRARGRRGRGRRQRACAVGRRSVTDDRGRRRRRGGRKRRRCDAGIVLVGVSPAPRCRCLKCRPRPKGCSQSYPAAQGTGRHSATPLLVLAFSG